MIRAEHVVYEVSGRTILDDISVSVAKGTTLTFMGLSGAGKSTFLKCISGLNKVKSGAIYVDGQNIVGLSEKQLNEVRKKVGMVFQYAALFDSLNVYENVSFGLRRMNRKLKEKEIAEIVKKNLALVGMSGVEDRMPSELSGGMKKRIGLARALVMNPDILLYDEPTAGLDPITAAAIAELIVKMRDELGVTSVLVTHDVQTIKTASDTMARLHEGKIVGYVTKEEIFAMDGIVKQFLEGSTEGPVKIS